MTSNIYTDLPSVTPLRGALHYESRVVEYNFDNVNAFKGPSVGDVDKQWLGLLNNRN
jgi:hypothetical protein